MSVPGIIRVALADYNILPSGDWLLGCSHQISGDQIWGNQIRGSDKVDQISGDSKAMARMALRSSERELEGMGWIGRADGNSLLC